MLPRAASDLSSLAALAQTRDGDLRPTLLLAHTKLFLSGPRDAVAAATYEALALGLIPLVGAEILGEVAALLADVPEAPLPVLATLLRELGGADAAGMQRAADLQLVRDRTRVLDGRALDDLIERSRQDAELAAALLERPEPGLFQRAALYRFAADAERAAIREALGRQLSPGSTPRLALSAEIGPLLARTSDGAQIAYMLARFGFGPSVAAAEAGLVGLVAEQELFALGLLSLGLAPEACTRLFLTLDPAVAHSVDQVLHLARLVRATPPHVATFLAAPDSALAAAGQRSHSEQPVRGSRPMADRATRSMPERRAAIRHPVSRA